MGGSRTQVNKSHKTRFASKASRHAHRTSLSDKGRISKSDKNATKGARTARIQRCKTIRDQKRAALLKEKRASGGPSSAPRVIVLFGLSSSVDLNMLARDLLTVLATENSTPVSSTVASSSYKFRVTVLQAPHGDLVSCMELAKVADLIAFVASTNSLLDACETGCSPIDSFGSQCLSIFRAIGLPSTAVFIRDLPADVKKKQDFKKMSISCLSNELPEDCKIYTADTKEELQKFMWLFREQNLSAPHWRSQRPYLMSQEISLEPDESNPGNCTLVLSGYVRAHGFSVNQLVHVSGAGDFQLHRIDVLKDPFPVNERKDRNLMDTDDIHDSQVSRTMLSDSLNQEPLLVENAQDPLAGEQTWPTEAEIAEVDAANKERKAKRKKMPRGTSDYQAAWIVDSDDDFSGGSDDEDDGMVLDDEQNSQLTHEGYDYLDNESAHEMEDIEEESGADPLADNESLTKEEVDEEIKRIKDANAEDKEFPDEVETPLDVPAKRRFSKYRGLKSFKTSSWDPKESLPSEYARIFTFDNLAKTIKHVTAKVRDIDQGDEKVCASVGAYARLHVKNVSLNVASKLCMLSKKMPVVACGLLQHESKMSVLHFSIRRHESCDTPLKSKEMLMFHVGFRQFSGRPLFSSDAINCDKHKMEKFLHPGRFSIASVYAPICFPPLPLIVLKCTQGEAPALAAIGSLRSVDPDRIILKRIILTGYPQRVSKSKAIVRFMFHNPDDVRWFKPVDVWTKLGRHGNIKEPVGTHGAMKCFFKGGIQQHDTVCMSLYKRVYPKWAEQLYPI